MTNAGKNQQGSAPKISITRPHPPQPHFRLPAAVGPSRFSVGLYAYGLLDAAAAVRQTPNLTSEYDLGAFIHETIHDKALGSAAWETWSTINSAFANQRAALRELNKTNDELNKANDELNKNNDELNKTNDELNKTNDELCTQRTALQAQLNDASAALTAATAALTAASAAGPFMSSIGHDPAAFNGNEMDPIQRRIVYDRWRSRILIRWAVDEHDFPTEFRKILHIASLLSGGAFNYVRADIHTIVSNSGDPTQWKWQSGADLLKTLADV